jgi:CheY-like chemotaxis protein
MADAGMIDQVLMNLCVNARDAMPQGGRLIIGTRRIVLDEESVRTKPEIHPGVFVCLSVTDSGHGMDDETLKHIFEPFFTTKETGKGTGLGLATVHGIITQHHGGISVETAVGKGTTFQVYLPALQEPLSGQAVSRESSVRGGTETILLVEDDQALRRFTALSLRKLGYAVLEAANGGEALRVWAQHQPRIDLLFTDMVMPGGVSGIDLAERMLENKGSLKVIVTSGYSSEKSKSDLLTAKGITFVAKPFDAVGLASAVRSCLDRR